MALVVDLSPVIQKSYYLDDFRENILNKSNHSDYSLSGSGIEIVRLMRIFGEDSLITGFLGGLSGEFFINKLENYHLVNKFYKIKDESKLNVRILNSNYITDIKDKEPRVTREELEGFLDLYMNLIEEEDRIILTGEIPNSIDESIIYNLIRVNKNSGKASFLDIADRKFFEAMEANPEIIFINKDLLEEFMKLILSSDTEILKVGKAIQEKYCEKLIINLGNRGFMFIDENRSYIVESNLEAPMDKLDNRGIIAGLTVGLSRNYDLDMILRLGFAFNMVYSLDRQITDIEMSLIKKYMKEVEIIPVNN